MNDSIPATCTCPSGDGSLSHPCPAHSTDCASGAINLIDAMLDNPTIPMKSKARLRTMRGNVVALLQQANRDRSFDFLAHLERQQRFSAHTFGPGTRAAGIVDHIRKELLEIEADPGDLREWIDVTILALDGAWRSGATPQQVIAAIVEKQTKNESRVWPHWSTMPADKAIEHDRSGEIHIGDANKMVAAPVAAAPVDGPTEVEWMMACNEIGGPNVAEEIITRAYSIAELPRSNVAARGFDPADPWRGLYAAELMPKLDGVKDWSAVHPDLPQWPNPEDEERALDPLVTAQGFAFAVVDGDYGDDAMSVEFDTCAWLAAWEPEPPAGDHWRLVMVQDTEDGPAAVYVRPLALIDASAEHGCEQLPPGGA
ncbi:dATP/dGTP pyrophosphohydrolase domain-containing protein [Stenotrophomonas sp.]|uniref:dATP/dGTP pyrophosphohydrolase domain-containing protein n=1 Tax=Stenotrophomonas sp. TaxID=69392 RepID=UPI0028A1F208|nr:dATP/dGTP pyrophosphohydrolase domain-containing protein [Stenotrophomonas sp.]